MPRKRSKTYWRDRMRRYRAEHPELAERERQAFGRSWRKNKKKYLAKQKLRRAELKAAGRCVDCGRKRPKSLSNYCRKCTDRRTEAARRRSGETK